MTLCQAPHLRWWPGSRRQASACRMDAFLSDSEHGVQGRRRRRP